METIAHGSGKSITNDCREVTAFKKLRFKHVFRPHENEKPAFSNPSGLKSVFEEASFRDGLVWKVDLNVGIKRRLGSLVLTAGYVTGLTL